MAKMGREFRMPDSKLSLTVLCITLHPLLGKHCFFFFSLIAKPPFQLRNTVVLL